MGMALHPDFEGHPYVYVMYSMYSYSEDGRQQARIQRLKHLGTHATLDEVVLDGLSALRYHIGGRIAFGPDGMLYIGTGDVERPPVSQDLQSLDGKILRLRPDGQIPKTTPSPTRLSSPMATVWFRGSPGIPKRVCSSTPSTGLPAPKWKRKARHRDEINQIVAGRNYGWPKVVGAPGLEEFQDPIVIWKNKSVPPGGMTFYQGDLFVVTLTSQALIRIRFGRDYEVRRIERWFALTSR